MFEIAAVAMIQGSFCDDAMTLSNGSQFSLIDQFKV
jgi:hypothetical protein